jgi:VanZ family protein
MGIGDSKNTRGGDMSAKSIRICGAAALVVLLLFAALGPERCQVRSGLGWQFDHIIGYFGLAMMFSLTWRRPLAVGGILMAGGMLLEALQALTPDRHCDLEAALYGAAGALAGALFAELSGRVLRRLEPGRVLVLRGPVIPSGAP